MNGLWVIFKKEVKDAIRDRRAILVAFLPAALGPLAMMVMLSTAADSQREAEKVTLQVEGREHAPDLVQFLEKEGVIVEELDGDPKSLIQAKEITVAMVIPENFAERFEASKPAKIEIFADHSLDKSDTASDTVRNLVQTYNRQIGSLRLVVRGIDPTVAEPVRLEIRDFSTRTSRAGVLLNTLQIILLMAAFFGGAGVAIDATAGERERKSWEPLLVHPLSSWAIAGGKWLAVSLFATVACLLSVAFTAVALRLFSLEALGIDPYLSPSMQLSLFALQVPLALFASALQMTVSLFSKTFKEAQGFLGILTLLPMLPVMLTMFRETKTAMWMYFVPIAGQQQLMTSIMRGDGMSSAGFLAAGAVTLALTGVLFVALTRLLRTERVIYGG